MRSCILRIFRIATAACSSCGPCSANSLFCKSYSPTAAIRARSSAMRRRRPCPLSKQRSSSARTKPKALKFCPADGWSSGRLRGSVVAEDWRRTGSAYHEKRSHSCASHPSASCSEKFVIKHEVHGPTLKAMLQKASCAAGPLAQAWAEVSRIAFVCKFRRKWPIWVTSRRSIFRRRCLNRPDSSHSSCG